MFLLTIFFFAVLTVGVYLFLAKSANAQGFVARYFATVVVKILCGMLYLWLAYLARPHEIVMNATFFLLMYAFSTVVEIVALGRARKRRR